MKWISGNSGGWHLGVEKEHRGAKSGKVYSRYVVTACNGKQLGGAWGHRETESPPPENICKHCAKILKEKAS